MQRRHLLIAAAGTSLFARIAQAHHGWSGFDETQPVYLEGRAAQVRWRNPHAEILLELKPQLALPPDLARRPLPTQAAPVDGPALLARAALPQRPDRRWTVELAPLTRLEAWDLGEIAPGTELSVIGFAQKQPQGEARLRAEYLFVGGKAYGLRSAPA